MANKRHKPEEIVTKLRQVDVLVGQRMARIDAVRQVRIVEQTYYRWRKQSSTVLWATARPGNNRSDGNQAGHALTFKLDHSMGADHSQNSLSKFHNFREPALAQAPVLLGLRVHGIDAPDMCQECRKITI